METFAAWNGLDADSAGMKTELVFSNEPWKKCVKEKNPFPACAEIMTVAANLELETLRLL